MDLPKSITWEELTHFTDKQNLALEALKKHKYLLYGGAMGGGKSYWLRWVLIYLLARWANEGKKNVRVGLFCEDYPALKDRHLSKIDFEFPAWLGILNKADYEFTLYAEYGSGVICFRNLDDASKYQSAEFAAIAVDELTKNQKEVFDFLRTRLRWKDIENTKFVAASNPGGQGHAWVKDIWMDGKFEPTEREAHLFRFIPSKATDNPYLPKSYFESLEGLPEEMRKAYIEGNWDLFKGQYFTEWNRERHVIHPFPVPDSWKKFRSYDHGRENPACCKWYTLDYDGRLWVYRELYVKGLNVDQIAEKINELSQGEGYQFSVADAAIFARTGMIDKGGAETIASTFARNGIMFIPSSKKRVDGWALMHQYLRWTENQPPRMIYFNTCYDSIRTIPSLVYDRHKVEDLDTNGEDHAADCDRYLLQKIQEQRTAPPMTEAERKVKQIKEERQSIGNLYEPEL